MVLMRPHSQNLRALPALFCFAFILVACIAASCFLRPATAFADYSMAKVSIQAQAETDGSLHVVEQRTFSFDGEGTSVWWNFSGLPSTAQVTINSVRMVHIGSDGNTAGYPQVLQSVPFVLQWRESGGPGTDAYSFDQARNTVYAFFHATDEQLLIELDYTVENGVVAYADVGEVYWKFVGEQWAADSENVEMTLMLPMPAGASVEPGENVRAWGHGPSNGEVTVNEDGSVTYTVSHVDAGDYAEARVLFPAAWLTNLPSGTEDQPHRTETHLSTALSEEQVWADQANRSRVMSWALVLGSALVCIVALAVGVWAYLRHGREYTPAFKEDRWRDVPDPRTHPALIGRLWRWNRESLDDFVATLMHLSCTGAVRIEEAPRVPDDGGEPRRNSDEAPDYLLVRDPNAKVEDPLDSTALALVFDVAGGGSDQVRFEQISACGKADPQRFVDALGAWQKLLSEQVAQRGYFEEAGKKWQKRLMAAAGVLVVCGAVAGFCSGDLLPFVFTLAAGVALFVLGNYCERRSREGNELCAKCKALRNWLRDGGAASDASRRSGAAWGELMVYAYLFGVAGKTAESVLSQLMAALGGSQGTASRPDGETTLLSVYPWWLWFAAAGAPGASTSEGAASAMEAFQDALGKTEAAAHTALSAMSGSGFSSAIGSGGGFSSGGGGGFSAGGGAR